MLPDAGLLSSLHRRRCCAQREQRAQPKADPFIPGILQDFSHKLREEGKIDFIEQFNEKLLVKQEGRNLQVRAESC